MWAISIENIVGTPGKTVTRSLAIVSSTLTGNEKFRSRTTDAPTRKAISTW